MAVTTTQVQQLYLAYFGRPAEQAGLTYWTAQANATVDQISAAFAQQPEYSNVYGSLTRAQTVDTLYQNLFGRTAQNAELTYWINSADVTVDRLALALVNGATGTDRLLLDSKTQFASTVTANAGASGTATGVANTFSTAVTNTGSTASQYTAANTAAKAAVSPTITDGTFAVGGSGATSPAVDFKGLTAGTVTLNNVGGAHAVVLPTTNSLVTDLTIKGTVDGLDASNAASAASLVINEGAATDIITTLHVNVSSSATGSTPATLAIDPSSSSALTTFDGASSTAGLNVGASGAALSLAGLASMTTGSGNDTLFVNTGTLSSSVTKVAALTIDAGAGNDNITSVVNDGALTINAGAGNDTVTATATGKAALTINAGAGNDTVVIGSTAVGSATPATAAHNVSITLGDGNDVVSLATTTTSGTTTTNAFSTVQGYTAVNSSSTAAQVTAADTALKAGLVTVTDFNVGADTLALGSLTTATLTNAQVGSVSSATSLSQAVQTAAGFLGTTAKAVAFQFGSDTYVYVDNGTAGVDNGDGLIQLSGVTATQLTSANFTHA